MVSISEVRVLSLDITSKGLAYASLEGPHCLREWGTVQVKDLDEDLYIEKIEALRLRFMPALLVLENISEEDARRGRAKALIERIELLALGKTLPVIKVSRGKVHSVFKGLAKTKQEIAQLVVNFFPKLEEHLPKPRRAWESEAERMGIFDAVSFALAAYRDPRELEDIPA